MIIEHAKRDTPPPEIASLALTRTGDGTILLTLPGGVNAVIETDAPLDDQTLARLRAFREIISARRIELEP